MNHFVEEMQGSQILWSNKYLGFANRLVEKHEPSGRNVVLIYKASGWCTLSVPSDLFGFESSLDRVERCARTKLLVYFGNIRAACAIILK